ncbi:hypothetical protein GCM10009618_07160 [Nesterenkonia lacusekhoensis]
MVGAAIISPSNVIMRRDKTHSRRETCASLAVGHRGSAEAEHRLAGLPEVPEVLV